MCKVSTMVIVLGNRVETATEVQSILTKYGCHIKARLGLHEADEDTCSNCGVVFLQLTGEETSFKALEQELNNVPATKAQLVQVSLD